MSELILALALICQSRGDFTAQSSINAQKLCVKEMLTCLIQHVQSGQDNKINNLNLIMYKGCL